MGIHRRGDRRHGGIVAMDRVSVRKEKLVLIMEAKMVCISRRGDVTVLVGNECDARDNNGDGFVHGFTATGDSWRMVSYDATFQMTNKTDVIFNTMDEALSGAGGLRIWRIEQRRHCEERLKVGLVEFFSWRFVCGSSFVMYSGNICMACEVEQLVCTTVAKMRVYLS